MSIILCLFPATLTNFDLINVPIVLINSLSVAEKRRQGVGVLVPPISLNALLAYSLIFAVKVGRFVCGFVDYPILSL